MKHITNSIRKDLLLIMVGFGIFVSVIFPFFAKVSLGLSNEKAFSPRFFLLCVAAGILVGFFNYMFFKGTVYKFISTLDEKINQVRQNLDDYHARRQGECAPEDCYLDIQSADNIGKIAGSFNRFIDKIRTLIKAELNIDNFLGELQKSLAIQDVADIIIKYFVQYFGGDGACVLGMERGKFTLLKKWNIEIDLNKIKKDYLHDLLREGNCVLHDDVDVPDLSLNIGVGEIKPKHIVFIPLQYQEKTAGLVFILSRKAFKQDFFDLESRTFIQQAASFLHNSTLMKRLETLAAIDELTEVLNRRFGIKRLSEEFERAKRHHLPLSIAMIDIDDFKTVNDTYGHQCGDYVLKTVADIASQNLRASDFVLRYGGEEFIVVLPGASVTDAFKVMDRIRKLTETQVLHYGSYELHLTFSGGLSGYPSEKVTNIDQIIQKADDALYKAKQTGKNKTVTVV